VRSCRRRGQGPWQRLPIAKAFINADEFAELAPKALLLRLRWALAAQSLWPKDAFRMFDTSGKGALQRLEFQAGLERLGLNKVGISPLRWPPVAGALFNFIDKDGKGVILIDEFRAATDLEACEWQVLPRFAQQVSVRVNGVKAPSSSSKKCSGNNGSTTSKAPFRLAPEMCTRLTKGRFKVRWKPHTRFRPVWAMANDESAESVEPLLSFWAPEDLIPKGRFQGPRSGSNAVKQRVPLGHYVSLSASSSGASGASTSVVQSSVLILEVTDRGQSGWCSTHNRLSLRHFLMAFFPHPLRYRLLWAGWSSGGSRTARGPSLQPLYVWEPIPPSSEYVALGAVVTLGEEAPDLEEMHCAPRPWAEQLEEQAIRRLWSSPPSASTSPVALWTCGVDTGVGEAGSLFSATAGAKALLAPESHVFCAEQFYAALPTVF